MSQQINLYEPRLRPVEGWATARALAPVVLFVLAAATLAAIGGGLLARRAEEAAGAVQREQAQLQERLAALGKEIADHAPAPALAADVDRARATLADRQAVMAQIDSGALGNTTGYSSFVAGFARQAQPNLWLTGFGIAAGGNEIEIRGRLLDPTRLPAYVQRLNGEPAFQGRRFAALDLRRVDPDNAGASPPVDDESPAIGPARYSEFVLRTERSAAPTTAASAEGRP